MIQRLGLSWTIFRVPTRGTINSHSILDSDIFSLSGKSSDLHQVSNLEKSMIREDNGMEGASTALDSLSSQRDVLYSCGYCGYALNLCSSHRNTTNIDSKYGKAIKKGVVLFYLIDESRFSHMDELKCLPFFTSKHSWGFFRQRTKLLCRKCGAYIGSAYDVGFSPVAPDNTSDSSSSNGIAKKYKIRIGALQPSSDESGIPLCT